VSYARFTYGGTTPGADSNDYVLFTTVGMFVPPGVTRRVRVVTKHPQSGTLKLQRSSDGSTWTTVQTSALTAPTYANTVDWVVSPLYREWRLVWTNAGAAQTGWFVDVALLDESAAVDGASYIWQLIPGASYAWRADLGMSYSAGASMTWTDQIAGSTLAQSTGAQVPVLNASDANLGNQASITLDGTDDNLTSNLAAAVWNFLHDGSGATILIVCRPTKTTGATNNLLATSAGAASRGIRLLHSATNNRWRFSVSDGAAFVIDINTGSGAAEPVSQAVYMDHLTSSTPDASLEAPPGTVIGTGSGTPSASAAAATLKLGDTANAFGGNVAEIVIWPSQLTAGNKTTLAAYTLARYGV
jgi:hypothetical protein